MIGASVAAESLLLIPRNESGSYENVSVSPSGKQFVYSEYDPKTSITQYWYDDRETGLRHKLDIDSFYDHWLISWTSDAHRFVVHRLYGLPGYVVSIDGRHISIQDLMNNPELMSYGYGQQGPGVSYKMMGINPDGRYIIANPELNYESWLFIWDENRYVTLNFDVYGDRVVWLNNTTFVAITNLGVIEYDVEQRTMMLRPNTEPNVSFTDSLSPDGRYVIQEHWEDNPSMQGLRICLVG